MSEKRNLDIQINAKDQASSVFKSVGAKMSSLKDTVKNVAVGVSAATAGLAATGIGTFFEVDKGMAKIANATGLTGQALKELQDTAKKVYTDGFGENFGEIVNVVSLVSRDVGDLTKDIYGTTEAVLSYKNAFGQEPNEILRAVASTVRNLGGDFKTNFDIIAKGNQLVGDTYGDYLDTVNEYAAQAQKVGYSTKDFINMIVAGSKAGIYMIDKSGDSMKEFADKIQSGDSNAREFYGTIQKLLNQPGRNFEEEFTSSDPKVRKKVMDDMITGALMIKDVVKRTQALKALIGSPFTDAGEKAIKALTDKTDYVGDAKGTTDKMVNLDKGGIEQEMTGLVRDLQTAVSSAFFSKDTMNGLIGFIQENKDMILSLVKALGDGFKFLGNEIVKNLPEIQTFLKSIYDFFVNNKDNILFFGKMAIGVSVLTTVISTLTTVFSTLFTWFTAIGTVAGPIITTLLASFGAGPLIAGMVALAGVIYLIYKNFDLVKQTITGVYDFLAGGFGDLWNGLFGNNMNVNGNITGNLKQSSVEIPQYVKNSSNNPNVTVNIGTSITKDKYDMNKLSQTIAQSIKEVNS